MDNSAEALTQLRKIFGFSNVRKTFDMYHVLLRTGDTELMSGGDDEGRVVRSPVAHELHEFLNDFDIDGRVSEGRECDLILKKDGSQHSDQTLGFGLHIREAQIENPVMLDKLRNMSAAGLGRKYPYLSELVTLSAGHQVPSVFAGSLLSELVPNTEWKYDEGTDQFITKNRVKDPKKFMQTIEHGMGFSDETQASISSGVMPDGSGYARLPGELCRQYIEELCIQLPQKYPNALKFLQSSELSASRSEP